MQENDKAVLVYTTFPSLEAAEEIGTALVDAGLAACVNILPGMVSIYVWNGARNRDTEVVMIIKTRAALAERVQHEVAAITLVRPRVVSTGLTEEPILRGALRTALDAVRDEVFGSTVG